jgi:hypothetical protein
LHTASRHGARVVFSGRSHEKGKALEEELSPNVASYRADAASASDTNALMNFAGERFGRLDCVVNNAGVGGGGDQSPERPSKALINPLTCCSAAPSWELSMLSRRGNTRFFCFKRQRQRTTIHRCLKTSGGSRSSTARDALTRFCSPVLKAGLRPFGLPLHAGQPEARPPKRHSEVIKRAAHLH